MHETHLIEPLIKGIASHAKREGGKRVLKIKLKIGLLLGVKEESFRETFTLLSKNTILEAAALEINYFPGTRIEVLSFDVE